MAKRRVVESRQREMLQLILSKGSASIEELCHLHGLSVSTVGRYLKKLEQKGAVKRTHGGARIGGDSRAQRYAYLRHERTATSEKCAIAGRVAKLILDCQTVILDGGTTCCEVARAVLGRIGNVVTNSVPIATLLLNSPERRESTQLPPTEVTLVGGTVYLRTGVTLGLTTLTQLKRFRAPKLVMSCAGVTEEGIFNINQDMVAVERRMMAIAKETILAVDHTKFHKPIFYKVCDLGEVDVIVTDEGVDRATRTWLDSLKPHVIYAPYVPDSLRLQAGG